MPKTEKNVYVDSFLGTSKNWEFCFQEIVWFWVIFLKSCANSCFYTRRLRLAFLLDQMGKNIHILAMVCNNHLMVDRCQ